MKSFVLSHGQQSIWFGQQIQQQSNQYQCAELLHFTESIDTRLLEQAIQHCFSNLPVFQALYDNPHTAQVVATPIVVEKLALPAYEVLQFARTAVIDVANPILSGTTLTRHWIILSDDGSVWWLARFHHITGDGFAFNAVISAVAAAYTALVDHRPYPPMNLICGQPVVPPPANPAVKDFWTMQPVSAPPSIFRHDPIDELVVTATTTTTSASFDVLAGTTAYYVAMLTGVTDSITLGLPMMNRPLGKPQIELSPTVSVFPLVIDLTDPHASATQALRRVRKHTAISDNELRQLLGFDKNHGPHVNFRPFSPQFSFAGTPALLETLSVGPINDCEFIFQSRPDGDLDIVVMARGSNRQAEVNQHAARLAEILTNLERGQELVGMSIATKKELAIIDSWNDTDRPLSATSLAELMESTRKELDAHTPLLGQWHNGNFHWYESGWVFAEIDRKAQELRDLGIGPGMVVAVHLERSLDFVINVAAIASVQAAWCPIDPNLPNKRQEYMLTASRAVAVIGASSIKQLAGGEVDRNCAYVLFTSGSTGTPKAVAVPQLGIVNRLLWMRDYYSISASDRILHKTPSSFDVSVWEYLLPVCLGIPTAIASPQAHRNPEEILRQLLAGDITMCHFVPSALKAFLAYYYKRSTAATSLRAIITSGEALSAEVAQRFRKILSVELHNLYGPAEAAIDVTAYTVTDADTIIPIGAPVWNTRIEVVDSHGAILPPEIPGNLHIIGCQVGLGYLGQPELTKQRFSGPPPRYDTGDQAYWHNGQLYYLGRLDSQVKIRGQRLELAEVESAISAVTGVEQAAVVVRDFGGEPALLAYVVGNSCLKPAIRQELTERLPEYMIPHAIITLSQLPTTANGKLDTAALPDPPKPALLTAELNPTEAQVASAFADILNVNVSQQDDNFFALGGSSLSAVELALRFDNLNIADVFADPTVAGIAATIDNQQPSMIDHYINLAKGVDPVPVFCFYPAGGLSWSYAGLVKYLPERSIYGIQASGITDESQRATSISQAATAICAEIKTRGFSQVALVGWSIGGVIAQEVACQLQDSTTVTALIILDAYPAEIWQQLPAPDDTQLWQGVLAMAGIATTNVLNTNEIIAAMRSKGGVFAELSDSTLQGIRTLVKHNAFLMRNHHTKAYPGIMHHFTAELDVPNRDPRLHVTAWENFATEIVEYHCPVSHPGMVSDEVFTQVSRILR